MRFSPVRILISIGLVAALTWVSYAIFHLNASTAGFLYLLLILIFAGTWGFIEASAQSLAASFLFNYYFFPPVGTLAIADPHNWVALVTFLFVSLFASRLSTKAKQRAQDAIERQQDIERLYSFSRSILLIGDTESFQNELIRKAAEVFQVKAAVLYDRRSGAAFRAGSPDFESMDPQLRDAAERGTPFFNDKLDFKILPVCLGSESIASLGLHGSKMAESVLQGVANLVAIGLERYRAQDLAHQIAIARQSEQLRTTLIDAMAHEFKTPLTSIRAATTMLLANPDQPNEIRLEVLRVADEEAERLRKLIDNTIEMARLDTSHIEIRPEIADIGVIIEDMVADMNPAIANRLIETDIDPHVGLMAFDSRLIKLAIKQLLDNALKYSPVDTALKIRARPGDHTVNVDITDHGPGIPVREQSRVFERFYRSPSVQQLIPGSGLGLNIARSIARAHGGELTVISRPGETTFHLILPITDKGDGV